jgi:hypothetical protein
MGKYANSGVNYAEKSFIILVTGVAVEAINAVFKIIDISKKKKIQRKKIFK